MMNHRALFSMLLITTAALIVNNVHADEGVAALFCEGSDDVHDADGEVYACWTEADDSKSKSKSRRNRGRRLSGKGGKGKKDECEVIEMDGEDSFDDFEDFSSVTTYLIECGKNAKAALCVRDGDDYEIEEHCDAGEEAIVTLLELHDRRRGLMHHPSATTAVNREGLKGDLTGSRNTSHRKMSRNNKKEVKIDGKEYIIFGYDE